MSLAKNLSTDGIDLPASYTQNQNPSSELPISVKP
jgi:hypothetical protein